LNVFLGECDPYALHERATRQAPAKAIGVSKNDWQAESFRLFQKVYRRRSELSAQLFGAFLPL
jgi:hypothetical protein